ncbi:hypothetical protein BN77_p2190002 [Rhizobium mesoamericanum STM3625]|uniref:Uncharacterized protein n=1 Tax=Rhizobium mesoamericanum STM3625 TaxID=1211777 RepID=K0PU23_9HYPH|nr:hypothetical protein BN77_p2190002 [Rhizobium mesoamericanum STM3625]
MPVRSDLRIEIPALVDELPTGLVSVSLESGDDFLFLEPIDRDRFQDHGFSISETPILDHLQTADVVVGLGEQANPVLQIPATRFAPGSGGTL